MKKLFTIIAILATLTLTACSTVKAYNLEDALAGYYPQTFIVVEVDRTEDIVTIETATGYQYDFYGAEDWVEGDMCACIMWDNGTDEIFDDVIVSVRYSGYLDMFR